MALAVLLTACSTGTPSSDSSAGGQEPEIVQLPDVTAYQVAEDEPALDVKRAAVRFLETTFNYDEGQGTAQGARERLTQAEMSLDAITDDTPFPENADTATSGAAEVIYPQLGGLTDDQASIMAVTEITTLWEDSLFSATYVIDLRLTRQGESWDITEIASLGGTPPAEASPSPGTNDAAAQPEVSEAAAEVLRSPNIELPGSAAWDILDDQIDDRLLELLLELSSEHTLSVTVLATGHPVNVFDSPSVSNHTRGRAVDIWAINGTTVSDLREYGPEGEAGTVMKEALEQGATEVGGPWALSSDHGATFTNTVHQDHLHIGFKQ